MTTINSGIGTPSSSDSAQFQPFSSTLFTPNSADHLALQNAQLQLQNQQLLLQKHGLEQEATSASVSPVPNLYSPNNVSNNVPQSTPEKSSTAQSPPSPADSGVVADSKSEIGNISQDLLHNLDQCNKLDDGLDFMNNLKSAACGIQFGTSTPIPEDHSNGNVLCFQAENGMNPSFSALGLSTSNSNFVSEVGLGIDSNQEPENNDVTISQSLAAIWSNPPPPVLTQDSLATPNMDNIMLQALQQQQLNSWTGPSSINHDGDPPNPPPGLYNKTLLQKQLQQQQNADSHMQALQQQMMHRRSQSTVVTRPSLINRSLSQQPGYVGGLSSLNQIKMNGLLLNSKSPSYSSWSNGQTSLPSAWPSGGNGKSASLFNSLQLSSGSNRSLNGSTAFRKQAVPSHMGHPPRLNRSISTPAKHTSYMNGQGLLTSLDDNPFFKMSDSATANGLSPFENKDNMGFSGFESQLYDIMRSSDQHSLSGQNLSRPSAKWTDMNSDMLFDKHPSIGLPPSMSHNMPPPLGGFIGEKYSRKVFVGGLPPDIDEEEIQASFRQFGPLVVDWPHKAESKSYFPPKGYAFLLFQDELSVQSLISCCLREGDKLYLKVSSPTVREKPVQIRPWSLSDSDFVLDGSHPLDPRKTIFVGGVPRPLRAVELAMIMDRLYGGVCYAGIDVDPELKYPKGAGRVAFSNQQSYIAAISARFVQLQHGDIDKRVEVKPYVLDDQHCDECHGSRCGGKFAPFFCANVTCLQYYCGNCWAAIHARPGRELHKPLVKEGADRTSRSMPYRW